MRPDAVRLPCPMRNKLNPRIKRSENSKSKIRKTKMSQFLPMNTISAQLWKATKIGKRPNPLENIRISSMAWCMLSITSLSG